MARIIDELDSPAGRGRNDGIAVKRQGGVIQKQAHCLGDRQPIFRPQNTEARPCGFALIACGEYPVPTNRKRMRKQNET